MLEASGPAGGGQGGAGGQGGGAPLLSVVTSRFPAPDATGVCADAQLRLTFAAPVTVGAAGKIQVFDASAPDTSRTTSISSGARARSTSIIASSRPWAAPATTCSRATRRTRRLRLRRLQADDGSRHHRRRAGAHRRDGHERLAASRVAYINCQMDAHIAPKGWVVTPAGADTSQLRFWEYQSTDLNGTPIDVSMRDPSSKQIDDATAAMMRDKTVVLAGWNPTP
jgi:hypothetical protein